MGHAQLAQHGRLVGSGEGCEAEAKLGVLARLCELVTTILLLLLLLLLFPAPAGSLRDIFSYNKSKKI